MVLDTSAVVAILQAEPQRDQMIEAITKAPRRVISAVSVLEAAMVLEGRYGNAAGADLELFLFDARVEIAPFGRGGSSRGRGSCVAKIRQRPASCAIEFRRLLCLWPRESDRRSSPGEGQRLSTN